MLDRWVDYQPTKLATFWIAVACVVATLVLGFGVGGWVSAGTAQEMVSQARAEGRHQLAAAVCVEDFMGAANASARLQKLENAAWYERDDIAADGGWATMPDKTGPSTTVAYACAEKLAQASTAVAK